MIFSLTFLLPIILANDKSILILFYSKTGKTDTVAHELGFALQSFKNIKVDIEPISCEIDDSTFSGKAKMYAKSMIRAPATTCLKSNVDINAYDAVIVGGPVWAWTIPKHLENYLRELPFSSMPGKLFAFTTSGGSGPCNWGTAFTKSTGAVPLEVLDVRWGLERVEVLQQFAIRVARQIGIEDPSPQSQHIARDSKQKEIPETVPEPEIKGVGQDESEIMKKLEEEKLQKEEEERTRKEEEETKQKEEEERQQQEEKERQQKEEEERLTKEREEKLAEQKAEQERLRKEEEEKHQKELEEKLKKEEEEKKQKEEEERQKKEEEERRQKEEQERLRKEEEDRRQKEEEEKQQKEAERLRKEEEERKQKEEEERLRKEEEERKQKEEEEQLNKKKEEIENADELKDEI
ncbi:hypothetical protein BLNAU_21659 [Blattamonas nauphoetae]|uniref:Flavodoxin-like domain-containing protein n=1 Tax=Blattamonas nauphoetae TaxID=2049346 RepID=A0ABQ9WVB7_9EUKA|nr:hypothetical protein BLNAU_21659 [Blattamonas nauphoetae]